MATVNLAYLIPQLRLKIGDLNPLAYRYTDASLLTSLEMSVSYLGRWMSFKYLLDPANEVYRNPAKSSLFTFAEPPVIEMGDDQSIVLMAAYILLEGSLENSAWDAVSWRDAEIAYSNLEGSRSRNDNLKRLWAEIMATLTPPGSRLATPLKGHLPGYKFNNPYEHEGEY